MPRETCREMSRNGRPRSISRPRGRGSARLLDDVEPVLLARGRGGEDRRVEAGGDAPCRQRPALAGRRGAVRPAGPPPARSRSRSSAAASVVDRASVTPRPGRPSTQAASTSSTDAAASLPERIPLRLRTAPRARRGTVLGDAGARGEERLPGAGPSRGARPASPGARARPARRPVRGVDAPLRPEGDRPDGHARVQAREPEVGREGDARPRGDEVLHRRVVVELEADARLEAGGPAARSVNGLQEERFVLRIQVSSARSAGGRRAASPSGATRGARCASAPRAAPRARRAGRPGAGRGRTRRRSPRSSSRTRTRASETSGSASVTITSISGPRRREAGQRLGDDARRRRRVRAHPQHGRRPVELAEVRLGLGELLEDHLGVLDEAPARRRQPHAARASLEQRDAGLELELRQLLRRPPTA